MRPSSIVWVFISGVFLTATLAVGQQPLKAHLELTRSGRRLKDASKAVIWLTPIGTAVKPPHQNPAEIPQLVQKDKAFHPSLLVIPVGGKVEFPNHDPFFHNVFSLFDGKRFDLGLYESGSTRFVQFDRPGISFIFCNIHSQMSAVVIALTTPYYAISNARGDFSFGGVPPGRYQMQIFHSLVPPETLQALNGEITISAGDTTIGSFRLATSELVMAHKNKYGRDYDRPEPDSPAYARP
ncbi:MAG TPA: carboxypeptidase regulatory-like domain-containing protein [Verrucomicrobiae bacterium]|nr:carboxypeptidase regulatory-like domain-containing protein [Verrucomicrobiae bacterium]